MQRVYIAGPITLGDREENIHNALAAADILLLAGYAPYVPHLTHFWHIQFPHPIDEWFQLDNEWLKQCNYLVRLPGESKGADAEVALAMSLNIPVFHEITTLLVLANRDATAQLVEDDEPR